MRMPFRTRLLMGLIALGTLPLAAALTAFALYVRSADSPAALRTSMDEIAVSGRGMITALDTAALPDAARAAVRTHAETIARRTTLARRAERLTRTAAAALGGAALLAAAILVGFSLWLSRRWSARLSRPIEELVDWTRRIERGAPLPPSAHRGGPAELEQLRDAFRQMADALEAARKTELERERLAAFRETARRVAHEMRGPLAALKLALRDRPPSPSDRLPSRREKPAPASDVVSEELSRLERLARDFHEFGRLPEGPESEIDVAELTRSVANSVDGPVRVAAADAGLTIRARYEPVRRAVENVVRNAAAFTDRRGIEMRATRMADRVTITVRDHGPGVPAELRQTVFEPYMTGRPGGTGLGLAIARHAVLDARGTLTVSDATDGGAVFTFSFPAA